MGREIKEEVDLRMRKAEREDSHLLLSAKTNLQVCDASRCSARSSKCFCVSCRYIRSSAWFHGKTVWPPFVSVNFLSTHTQALEESLAEACQLGLESDWQREVVDRLQQVDTEQERNKETLAELHRKSLAEEERLADVMRGVAGRKVRREECV